MEVCRMDVLSQWQRYAMKAFWKRFGIYESTFILCKWTSWVAEMTADVSWIQRWSLPVSCLSDPKIPLKKLETTVVYTSGAFQISTQTTQCKPNTGYCVLLSSQNSDAFCVVCKRLTIKVLSLVREILKGPTVWWCVTKGCQSVEELLQSQKVRLKAVLLFGKCQGHTVLLFRRR